MKRLFTVAAIFALMLLPMRIAAQYQLIELTDVQLGKSPAATIQGATGDPIPKALVQEFSANWKTVLRSTSTNADGGFSFAPLRGRKIYFIQISAPGFDPLCFRLQVDVRAPAKTDHLEIIDVEYAPVPMDPFRELPGAQSMAKVES